MTSKREHWDIRTLVDGHNSLRAYLVNTPAKQVPFGISIKLAEVDRKLRPVSDFLTSKRMRLAQEFGCVTNERTGALVPGEGEDALEEFAAFQGAMADLLNQPYPIQIEPLTMEEREQLPGLTLMHIAMMPFLFQGGGQQESEPA